MHVSIIFILFFSLFFCSSTLAKNSSFTLKKIKNSQEVSPLIVVDQFGYLPHLNKKAVIREPQKGFDAAVQYEPGKKFLLIDINTNKKVFSKSITAWRDGEEHSRSGDKVWIFDFSEFNTPGTYQVVDKKNKVYSAIFEIKENIYNNVLKQAMRYFYYQRAGFAKTPPYADIRWADKASHIGAGQDTQARLYSDKQNASTERDLSGGWYDAGDYNKYTNWTANYVITLLHAYLDNPSVWTDDYQIPESANGIPDIIDEVVWGLDWLLRMQNNDGSVLSIVGLDFEGSPPSSATKPSFYGPASTSATYTTAAAFAFAAHVLPKVSTRVYQAYADGLKQRAQAAWLWAQDNPNVKFYNNKEASKGLGAGQQEVNDIQLLGKQVQAAIYLFDLSLDPAYRVIIDKHYSEGIVKQYFSPFIQEIISALLYYSNNSESSPAVSKKINDSYQKLILSTDRYLPSHTSLQDPYNAYLKDYTWGSSKVIANKGNMYMDMLMNANVAPVDVNRLENAALGYINFLHGVNPFGLTFLSNMGEFGAERSVTEFYHAWFKDGSKKWDSTKYSTFGPAPGFLVGGINPRYQENDCCPKSCGDWGNNRCGKGPNERLTAQPAMKSYVEFNDTWPLDSWEVTENSNGYQVAYIRLLSKFVKPLSQP